MNLLSVLDTDATAVIQDGRVMTNRELLEASLRVSAYVSNKFPRSTCIGVHSDNSVDALSLILGVSLSGRDVLGLPSFMKGPITERAISDSACVDFIGHGTDLDHGVEGWERVLPSAAAPVKAGNFLVLSSGSTGEPTLRSVTSSFMYTDQVDATRLLMASKFGTQDSMRVYYPAPITTTASVYLSLIACGHTVVSSNMPPVTDSVIKSINDTQAEVLSARPSFLLRLKRDGLNAGSVPSLSYVMSSTGILKKECIDYCRDALGVQAVVDIYSTTDAGIIAARDALTEESFTMLPGIESEVMSDGTWDVRSPGVGGTWREGKFFDLKGVAHLDDIIEVGADGFRFVSRSPWKAKVNGFTVITPLVSDEIRKMDGVIDCVVYARRDSNDLDTVVAQYTGRSITDQEFWQGLKDLPSYCIPKEFNHVDLLKSPEAISSSEQYSVPTSN